jgi:hypothetical protein
MFAGKSFGKMFERNNSEQNDKYDRNNFEFFCENSFNEVSKIIENFFNKNMKKSSFKYSGNGKFIFDLIYQTECLKVSVNFYKINDRKYICSLYLKEVQLYIF